VFVLTLLWLFKRHHNLSLRGWLSARRAQRGHVLETKV
jgi:hypothetical protein